MKFKLLLQFLALGVALSLTVAGAQAASITGRVFNDLNGNGSRDTVSEYGVPSWTLQLVRVAPPGPIVFATTDANGSYTFGSLPAGTYTLSAVNPSPWLQTSPSGAGTFSITLNSGSTVTGKDFACKLPVHVPQIQWQRSLGGYRTELPVDTQQTADGGYVVGGSSQSPPNFGGYDYFVARLDAVGNQIWARNYGDAGDQWLDALKPTSDGGFVLIGRTGYIVRLNADGDVLWDVYVSGATWGGIGTADGGVLACGTSGVDAYVVRLDSQGNKLWDRFYGGTGYDGLYYPVQNPDGGFTISGESSSGISGDKTTPNFGDVDYWLVKIDSAGNKVWDASFGGDRDEQCQGGLGARSDGSVVMCGFSASGASGNKSAASFGSWDAYLVCVDPNGNKVWDKAFGGSAFESLRDLQVTEDDGIVFVGSTGSGMSGNKVSPSFGGDDGWLVRADAAGNKMWDLAFGGSRGDGVQGVTLTEDGGLILTGTTTSNDGNVTAPLHGGGDIWVLKLSSLSCTANPLTLVAAAADCAQQKITVYFSDPVNPAQALQAANYTLSGGAASVQAVSFGASTLEVVLDVPGLAPGVTYTLSVQNLTDDCGNALAPNAQLTVACPGLIRGKVFIDADGDCVADGAEFPVAKYVVELSPGPRYALADRDGEYEFSVAAGDYTLRTVPSQSLILTQACPAAPNTHMVTVANGQIATGNNYGLMGPPEKDCPDLFIDLSAFYPGPKLVHVVGPSTPCCGTNFTYEIYYENQGNAPVNNASIQLHLPPQCSYVASTAIPSLQQPCDCQPPNTPCQGIVTGNCVQWDVGAIPVNGNGIIRVEVHLECSSETPCQENGTGGPPMLNAMAHIFPKSGDCQPANNHSHHQVKPCCSFDPNDKQVFPKGCGPTGLIPRDQPLTYLVRFQNIGSGPAHVVVVQDVLDEDLDLSTLQFLGSSHPNAVQIIGRELRWIFPNIELPPAALNETASQGYVKYRVHPRADAPIGTVITNSAAIHFDANEPIVTITTTNTITDDPLPKAAFTVMPRPGTAGHTNDFDYTGGTGGATFRWQFGPGAIPETSTETSPRGVIFPTPGPRLVSLEVSVGDCLAEPALRMLTVGRPQLVIARTAGGVTLSWPGDGYRVEETDDLTAPIQWGPVASPVPSAVGGWYLLELPEPGNARFYRLEQAP